MTDGVTNDPATWLVDWTKPIEWDDGTPAINHALPWHGQVTVDVDPLNLPAGVLKSAVRAYLIRHAHDGKGAVYGTHINIIAAYGSCAHGGCTAKIVNSHHRTEREAMEEAPGYGMF